MSTILVVDDDAMTLRMLEYNLGSAGHQVVTTTNAAEAANLAARHKADAVILDVMMPGRSGYEVMADLNQKPQTRNIPILMLSSLSQSSHRVKGLREGADEYVGKPFDPEELLLRLNRLLNLGRGSDAEFEGNLATIPFAEVTQSLLHSTTDGVLEVVHGNRRGQIVLEDSRATEATFGKLNGQQAVLAMLELTSGTFRFVRRPRDLSATDHGIDLHLDQIMFTAAWLQDEMGRWPEVPPGTLLWVSSPGEGPPDPPAAFKKLPILTVWQEVERHPGTSVGEIVARELAAPRVVQLTLRILVHTGALSCNPPEKETLDLESTDFTMLALLAAAAATLQGARTLGNDGDLIHILLLADKEAQSRLLEIRQQLPPKALAAPGDSLTGAWAADDTATVPLAAPSGQLILHLAKADSKETRRHLKERIGDFAAVLVWAPGGGPTPGLDDFVDWIEDGHAGQWGLVVTDDATTPPGEAPIPETRRWRVRRTSDPDLAELLRLLAAATTR